MVEPVKMTLDVEAIQELALPKSHYKIVPHPTMVLVKPKKKMKTGVADESNVETKVK